MNRASEPRVARFARVIGFARGPTQALGGNLLRRDARHRPLGHRRVLSAQAALAIRTPFEPLRLRLDGLFSDAGSTQVQAFTASAVLAAPARWTAAPYLMAGGGGYMENGGRMTAGWNLGLGMTVRAGHQVLFMESRVHAYRDALAGQPYLVPNGVVGNVREPNRYLWHPLTFGFRF